jgi:hypothetical protein
LVWKETAAISQRVIQSLCSFFINYSKFNKFSDYHAFLFIIEKAGKTIFLKKAAKKTSFFAIKVDF